jgi:hypothetical protein
MALDKLVDSTQLDADLVSVADAIRTKGGTSAALAFPADFVSAVEAIPTGGGGGLPQDLSYSSSTFIPVSDVGTNNNYYASILQYVLGIVPSDTLFVRVKLLNGEDTQYSLVAVTFAKCAYALTSGYLEFYRYNPAGTVQHITRDGAYSSYSLFLRSGSEYQLEVITGTIN